MRQKKREKRTARLGVQPPIFVKMTYEKPVARALVYGMGVLRRTDHADHA